MRKKRTYTKEYLKRRDNQSHHDIKVPMLTGTNFEESDIDFTAAVRRHNALIGIPLYCLLRTDAVVNYNVA